MADNKTGYKTPDTTVETCLLPPSSTNFLVFLCFYCMIKGRSVVHGLLVNDSSKLFNAVL